MQHSWISPHKFAPKGLAKLKRAADQQQAKKKAADLDQLQVEDIVDSDDEADAIDTSEAAKVEKEATEQSSFAHLDKWFSLKPQNSQLKGSATNAAAAAAPKLSSSIQLKIVEEMLRVAIAVYNRKVEAQSSRGSGAFSFEDEIIRKGTTSDKIATLSLMVAKNPMHQVKKLDQLLKLCASTNGRAAELAVKTAKDLLLNNLLPVAPSETMEGAAGQHAVKGGNHGALFGLKLFKDQNLKELFDAVIAEQKQRGSTTNDEKQQQQQKSEGQGQPQKRKHITFGQNGSVAQEEVVVEMDKIDEKQLSPLHEKFFFFWYFEDLLKKRFDQFIDTLIERSKNTTPQLQIRAILDMRDLIRGTSKDCAERNTLIKAMVEKLKDKNSKVASSAMQFMTSLLNPILNAEDSTYNSFYVRDLDRRAVVHEVAQVLYNTKLEAGDKLYAATLLNRVELMEKVDRELAKDLIQIYLKTCEVHFKSNDSDSSTMRAILTGLHRAIRCAECGIEPFVSSLEIIFTIARKSHFSNAVEALRVIWYLLEGSGVNLTAANAAAGSAAATTALGDTARLASRFYQILYEKLFDDGVRQHSSKTGSFLSLLFKAMRRDSNVARQKAFCKRIMQSAFNGTPEYACSCVMLLKNFFNYHPHLKDMYQRTEGEARRKEVDGHQKDADGDVAMADGESEIQINAQQSKESQDSTDLVKKLLREYDPTQPSPLRAGAELSSIYELLLFTKFYHPSGSLFAANTLQGKKIKNYEGNPMEDFTLIKFLDKFMYKKAKKKEKMTLNPLKSLHTTGSDQTLERQIEAMNAAAAATAEENQDSAAAKAVKLPPKFMVRPDEMFRYKFMQKQQELDSSHVSAVSAKEQERMELAKRYRESMLRMQDQQIENELKQATGEGLGEDNPDNEAGSDAEDDNLSVYSYSQLDQVLQDDVLDDEEAERLLLEYDEDDLEDEIASLDSDMDDDDEDDEGEGQGKKKKQKRGDFGYDVTAITQDEPNQDEIAALLEEGEDQLFKQAKLDQKMDRAAEHEAAGTAAAKPKASGSASSSKGSKPQQSRGTKRKREHSKKK